MATALTSEQGLVTDAAVDIRGRIGRKEPLSKPVPAPGYFLQPRFYQLNMNFRDPGDWTFKRKIDSSLGETVLEVPLQVADESDQQPSSSWEGGTGLLGSSRQNWILIAAATVVFALSSGGWIFMRLQRAESGTDGTHQTMSNTRRKRI